MAMILNLVLYWTIHWLLRAHDFEDHDVEGQTGTNKDEAVESFGQIQSYKYSCLLGGRVKRVDAAFAVCAELRMSVIWP